MRQSPVPHSSVSWNSPRNLDTFSCGKKNGRVPSAFSWARICLWYCSAFLPVCPEDFQAAQSSSSPGKSMNSCYNFERLELFMNFHLYLDPERLQKLKRPRYPHILAFRRAYHTYCVMYGQPKEWYDLVSTSRANTRIIWVKQEHRSNMNIFHLGCWIWDF